MTITDIINPIFRIISDQNIHVLERETRNLCLEGWHPVGDVGRKDKDWVQVMVKESNNCYKCSLPVDECVCSKTELAEPYPREDIVEEKD